eukprot:552720_1
MGLVVPLWCINLFCIVLINSVEYRWCSVKTTDVEIKSHLGVDPSYSGDDNLVIDATITSQGCGSTQSHIFASISDYFDNDILTQWVKIRYTTEFWGASSCWSLFGNTHYGHFAGDFESGLIEFNIDLPTTDDIIQNELLYGSWKGETVTCNNEKSNFWHSLHGVDGYKGSITVEQRRNTTVSHAGVGSGHSCSSPGVTKVRYSDIRVGYEESEQIECDEYNDLYSEAKDDNKVVIVGILFAVTIAACLVFVWIVNAMATRRKKQLQSQHNKEIEIETGTTANGTEEGKVSEVALHYT